ncbi:MAG: hypothetical protein PHR92_10135 [Lachnospiraceae bacterium]|nr:hypothetical protein [Lachnospiraceae bacterium]
MRNKKRLSAAMLGLCLLCGGTSAMADADITTSGGTADTAVTYTVASTSFTVTIPASVTIDPTAGTGTVNVALDATNYKPAYDSGNDAMQIWVFLSKAANRTGGINYLSDGTNKIAYTIKKNGSDVGIGTSPASNAVIDWTTRNSLNTASADLALKVTETATVAGSYSDTLTFTVKTMQLGENDTPIL